MAVLLGCLIILPTQAKVLTDDIYIKDVKSFSFKDVCQKMVGKVYPLIGQADLARVDCMKKKVNATEFCAKQLPEDPYLARGKVLKDKVECISGTRVIFKYLCKKNDYLCRDKEVSCFKIKEKMANRLQISHSSLVDKRILSCYFAKNNEMDVKI